MLCWRKSGHHSIECEILGLGEDVVVETGGYEKGCKAGEVRKYKKGQIREELRKSERGF